MLSKCKWMLICCLLVVGTSSLSAQTGKSKTSTKPTPYIMHVVKFGETLTKIAKKYEVSQTDILKANPSLTANNLSPEQIIRIPNLNNKKVLTRSETDDNDLIPKQKVEVKVTPKNAKTHVVQAGQTLYAISKIYGVKVEDLQKWNDLKDFNVKVGSQLIVGEADQKLTTDKPVKVEQEKKFVPPPVPVAPVVKEQLATDDPATSGQDIDKPDVQASDNETQKELLKLFSQRTGAGRIASVRGTGAPMTTSLGAMENVYFAMHKTLPVGTILKIKNLVNSKVIYAKVIGKLPDTDENKHVVVRYSLGVKKDLQLQNGKCYVQIEYPE